MIEVIKAGASCGAYYVNLKTNDGGKVTVWIAEDGAVSLIAGSERLDWDDMETALADCDGLPSSQFLQAARTAFLAGGGSLQ